jgi:hypothetical protein
VRRGGAAARITAAQPAIGWHTFEGVPLHTAAPPRGAATREIFRSLDQRISHVCSSTIDTGGSLT